jgi:hypothetical protein
MQITGKITDISIDYTTNKPRLTLIINEKQTFNDNIDELRELDKLSIEIKKYREKRSLDANSYYWSLINQLSNKLEIGKEELHEKLLKEYSQIMLIPLLPTQNPNGYFKYYDEYKTTTIGDKEAIYYKVYKPSSEMDSKEFWLLIKGLESECVLQGIEILEERKLREMMEDWERNNKR